MAKQSPLDFMRAIDDFRRARRKAKLQRIFSRFSREAIDLLDYQEISKKLKGIEEGREVRREIPLDSIIGSVGRYKDFTRTFLPRQDSDEERWARVQVAMTTGTGVPPIEVYQIGEAYFVLDGNHRVSVARDIGMEFIEANVREVKTKASLSPEDSPDELIIKIEYSNFLEHTRFDEVKPEADLSATICGTYPIIEEHISVHRYYMGINENRDIPEDEAVAHWYDEVYLPIVETIREFDILQDFPEQTETDLYLWLSKHRASLEEELEWQVDLEEAAEALIDEKSTEPERVITRVTSKLHDVITPDTFEAGPPPGDWRRVRTAPREKDRLFSNILAPISGEEESWRALEQAITIVQKEKGRLRGLHIVPTEKEKDSKLARSIESEFIERCRALDLEGDFAIDIGGIARKISERARWNDLVVLHLAHPPSKQPIAKLSSGFRTLVQRCPIPILAVKDEISDFKRALLAFDGSPKAKEALYVACYFVSRWGTPVTILAVKEKGENTAQILNEASEYLRLCGVDGMLIKRSGSVAEEILQTAEEEACDLIIMGGYRYSPLKGVILGSAVDQVMREGAKPILFCR